MHVENIPITGVVGKNASTNLGAYLKRLDSGAMGRRFEPEIVTSDKNRGELCYSSLVRRHTNNDGRKHDLQTRQGDACGVHRHNGAQQELAEQWGHEYPCDGRNGRHQYRERYVASRNVSAEV